MKQMPLIIEEIYPVPVDKVWKAITDKEQMKEWYFTINDFVLEKGAVFDFYEPGNAKQYYHRCVIQEIIPEKKLQYTWTHPIHSKGESLLTWILEPVAGGTKVTLTHEGLENFADAGEAFARKNYEEGWKEILGVSLKKFLNK